MKRKNSAYYAAMLSAGLTIEELPLSNRSARWWDMFWYYINKSEAQRLREKA